LLIKNQNKTLGCQSINQTMLILRQQTSTLRTTKLRQFAQFVQLKGENGVGQAK